MRICTMLLALLGSTGPAGAQSPDLPDAPGRLVDVGGRRLHLLCTGNGPPTVVLEAGASSFAIDFTLVQRDLARVLRVCAYDRAGMGWSDADTTATPPSPWQDLHNLLTTAGERGPYLLVGASRGAFAIRAFQAEFAAEVAGLVFIDPSTEDRLYWTIDGRDVRVADVTAEQVRASNPTRPVAVGRRSPQAGSPFDRLPSDIYSVRLLLDQRPIASFPDTVGPAIVAAVRERERALLSWLDSLRRVSLHPLADLPTVVLSRGAERNQARERAHVALAALSQNPYHCVVPGAEHEIHLSNPSTVVRAIMDVMLAIRNGGALRNTAC